MNPLKKPFRVNAVLLVLILGLVAFFVYIYFFVNPAQVVSILSKTNLTIYAGAFVAYLLYTLCSSLVWQRLLNNLSVKITKRKAFLFTWVGLFFEATVPQLGWSGEVSKTYLLTKDSNAPSWKNWSFSGWTKNLYHDTDDCGIKHWIRPCAFEVFPTNYGYLANWFGFGSFDSNFRSCLLCEFQTSCNQDPSQLDNKDRFVFP